MQQFEVLGCDCTCSNLHSIFCGSLSVYFYCYFISHDKEVKDPLLAKKIVFITNAAQRKSCSPCSRYFIPTAEVFKFTVTGFPFFVLLAVLTMEEMHFILPEKTRYLEELLKCVVIALFKYYFIIAFSHDWKSCCDVGQRFLFLLMICPAPTESRSLRASKNCCPEICLRI